MARKVGKRDSRYLAKLVTENRAPCAFCHREVDDEITYGKLYAIGDIQCHYFCALLSCCLVQKGPEVEGLFGFMYKDILAELERSKKHKCSFCSKSGANLGCSISSCRKQFHLPCGRDRNAVSLYYGTYKSFCQLHAPKQNIPDHIMSKAKLRLKGAKVPSSQGDDSTEDMVCVICYEAVDAFPTVNTFWPPCCGKDAWFHRSCLQRMALSAGMHYLKCPLCNDKQNFYDAVIDQGYYVPDRDAAWELEQNAFAEIYERPLNCTAEICECPLGRNHDADQGEWDIKLCLLCGSVGAHAHCIGASETTRYVCLTCTPAAPEDIQALADTIDKMIIQEQAAAATSQRGPIMPSRMSLRRTKARPAIANRPSSSRSHHVKTECENTQSSQTNASRQELNLSTPRKLTKPDSYNSPYKSRPLTEDSNKNEVSCKSSESFKRLKSPVKMSQSTNIGSPYKCMEALSSPVKLYESLNNEGSYKMDGTTYKHDMDEKLMSPMKLFESLNEKACMSVIDLDEVMVERLRKKFRKPGPLSEKRKIMEDILEEFKFVISPIKNLNTSETQKGQPRDSFTPRKSCDTTKEVLQSEDTTRLSENTDENIEITIHETPKKSTRSSRRKSAKDVEKHNPNTNIDSNTTGTKIGLDSKELDHKEISEDKGEHGKDKSVKTVEPEEKTDVAATEETPKTSTSRIKKSSKVGKSQNPNNNIDSNAAETKIGNYSEELDNEEISEDKNDQGKYELVKFTEPEERTSVTSLEVDIDDSSTSTFQLPSEFIANTQSDQSNTSSPIHKTIETIFNSSKDLEIKNGVDKDSETKCAFKFSPLDKEKLDKNNVHINLESFKKTYLCEVGKEKSPSDKHCKLNLNLGSVIDFAVDESLKEKALKPKKRKHSESKLVLVFDKNDKKRKLSKKDSNVSSGDYFEEKKEMKSPLAKKNDKIKVKFLSKRHEKKLVRDKVRREKKILRRKTHEKIKMTQQYPDKTMVSKEKEITVKEIETKRHENVSYPDDASDISNKTVHEENGPRKRKFQECSQWMAEITELDKKREIEAKRKAKNIKRNLKNPNDDTSGKDATKNMQEEYSQNNKKVEQKHKTDRKCDENNKFDKDNVKETKGVTTKANESSQDGEMKKENIGKHKKEKLSREHKRQHKLDKKYKKDKKRKEKYEKSKQNDQNIELTIDSSEKTSNKKRNKMKTKLSIKNNEKDISVKIKWKKKQLRLRIKESKKEEIKKIENEHSKFKQYVLQYFSEITPKQVLVKPEKDISPLKRKYVKQEKSPDKLKQLSIQSFFKTTPPS